MGDTKDIAVLVGSLRQKSFSRKLATAFASVRPLTCALEQVEIGGLPLYNEDLEGDAAWAAFRQRIKRADAVLFVTPEYNRSVPGVLKNAIDVGSRPYGQSVWARKPAGVISSSPGVIGGFGANHHLRQSMVFLDMPVMQQPEAYIGQVDKIVSDDGKFATDSAREFADAFMRAFAQWVALLTVAG
jgi:chromate reductase, NAD(P)H dehydrogenase (quinone)